MNRVFLAGAMLTCAVALAGAPARIAAQAAPPWGTFHGNAQRDGSSPASGPANLQAVNTYALPPGIVSSPAIDGNGVAYLGGSNGKVYALDPAKPNLPKWSFSTSGPVRSSPTLSLDGSTVFVGSDDGHLYALKTADGSKLWDAALNAPISASPLLGQDGKTIFINTQNGTILAFSATAGTQTWTCTPGTGSTPTSMALSGDGSTLYVAISAGFVYAVPATGCGTGSGGTLFYLDGSPISAPSLDANGNIYVNTSKGTVFSFAPGTSTARWTFNIFNKATANSSEAFLQGNAIFGAGNNYVYAINQQSGQQVWQYHTDGPIQSSPAVAKGNGRIYIGSTDHFIYALDSTGTLINKRDMQGAVDTSPAIAADGSVWVASESGLVLRLKDIAAPPTVPAIPSGTVVLPTGTATATPAVTAAATGTATPTATATSTLVPLSVKARATVKAGKTQTISVTSAANTGVQVRIDYPNGDHQSHKVVTDATGNAAYSFKQGGSKITHSHFSATVTAKAGAGATQNTATTKYTIGFGKIDVSAEPRTQSAGKTIKIFVHAKKNSRVTAYLLTPTNRSIKLADGKTGPKGFAAYTYRVPKGLVKGTNRKVIVLARFASGKPSTSTKTTFTIK